MRSKTNTASFARKNRNEPRHDKTNKMTVRPVKTQISQSYQSLHYLRLKEPRGLSYPLSGQRRLWSDWADAQADLSFRWAYMPFCWFCHDAAQISLILWMFMFDGSLSSQTSQLNRSMTKPRKRPVHPGKTQISLGVCPVWSKSLLCAQWVAKDPRFLLANSEDSDQPGRWMPRLIWVFAGCTDDFVALSWGSSIKVPLTLFDFYRAWDKCQTQASLSF